MAVCSPFYLCTGFHRSGTSLVANSMYANNVDMGTELMGPSFGNPKGHFEDVPLVNLHDRLLSINNTDWRYSGYEPLTVTEPMLALMKSYLSKRVSCVKEARVLGAKDPRAVFFLSHWENILGENLKAILVFRDWRYSVSSLLKRHSRELIQFTSPIQGRSVDYTFWSSPDVAVKMWLASAEAMLRHKTAFPNNTLLFNQQAFISRQDELKSTAENLGFDKAILDCREYQAALMQQNIPESLLALIPENLQRECDQKQAELAAVSDIYTEESVALRRTNELARTLLRLYPTTAVTAKSVTDSRSVDFNPLTFEDGLELLKILPKSSNNDINWNSLLNKPNVTAKEYDTLYVLAIKHDALNVAEIAIRRALHVSPLHYRFIHLGDIFIRRKQPDEAKQCYQQAASLMPDNATPLAKLAEAEALLGNVQQAEALLDDAKRLDPSKPAIVQAEVRLKQAKAKFTTTVHPPSSSRILWPFTDYTPVMSGFEISESEGRKRDDLMVRVAFFQRDNFNWLREGCAKLTPAQSLCLVDYVTSHFLNYWPRAVLETELLGQTTCDVSSLPPYDLTSSTHQAIGVCIHVYYPKLLKELLVMLGQLPPLKKVVITCREAIVGDIQRQVADKIKQVEVVVINNTGRDIYPWVTVAQKFSDCDLVLKLHSKSTPHASALNGWRLQLLWQLCGRENVENILTKFSQNPKLGMMIPKYHPALASDINWGENFEIAREFAAKLDITLPQTLDTFPAGSMFWYRPQSLTNLLERDWAESDFPEERGQIDGTLMHALERLLCICVEQNGFEVAFVD